jgi:adenylosuccinate lyase
VGLQLEALLDPRTFVGRAPEQVTQFLAEEVAPALAPYRGALDGTAEVLV